MNTAQAIAGPSSPRMTRSATGTKARQPLATLPLSHFAPAVPSFLAPPSPLSISHKRSAPGSGSPSSPRGDPGSRKVSRTDKSEGIRSGLGSGRRGDPEITPRVKERLEKDELGLGRSPARRLFMGNGEVGNRSGISGTSPFPLDPTPPSNPQTQTQPHSPFLAPSPPLSPRTTRPSTPISQPTSEPGENGVTRNIHDPGFPIHTDPLLSLSLGVGIGTPDSRRNRSRDTYLPPPPDTLYPPSPSTSTSSASKLDEQENIPPVSVYSGPSTPGSGSKERSGSTSMSNSTRSSTTKSGSSVFEEEDTLRGGVSDGVVGVRSGVGMGTGSGAGTMGMGMIGLGRSGRSGKSKLIQMMRMRGVSDTSAKETEEGETEPESEGEGEELTPGKKGWDPKGKEKLVGETEG